MGQVGGRGAIARIALGLALAACGASTPPPAPTPVPPAPAPPAAPAPPPHELSAPPVTLTLVDGATPQVFHIVDELSRWYPEAHAQYSEWALKELTLDDGERAMLAKHAKLRAKRRWGALDQAFYVGAPIAEAARAAVEKKLLTAADAEDERTLLEHFATRLQPFLAQERETVAALEGRFAAELPRAAPLFAQLGRLCELTEPLPLTVVLVPSPGSSGAEGRVLHRMVVLEVAPGADAVTALFHHLAHAVFLQRRGTIAIGAGKCDESVDDETLEEALAYAVAPGLLHPPQRDPLRETAEADAARSLRDPRVRAVRLGLALRTALSGALEGGHETLSAFLPRACEAWANVAKP